jgi:hypothetical protein
VSFKDKDDLQDNVNSLEGMTIRQIASDKNLTILQKQWQMVLSGERKYIEKQIINDIIEQDYFKVPKNSSEDPDLILDDGEMFELKVSHLFKSRGLIRPKYRLVLKVLNYEDMAANQNWKNSALYKKLRQIVIVFYYKDEEKPPWEWIVASSFIWLSSDYDERIQSDYTLTRDRVLAGQKISESDTEILANCPKHNSKFCWWCHIGDECNNPKKKHPAPHPVLDGALRKHPAMGMAEKRGYCIPAQYMAVIFSNQIRMNLERRGKSYGVPIENVPHLN